MTNNSQNDMIIDGSYRPAPDTPNWDIVNNGYPDPNWKSKYTLVPGTGWVLTDIVAKVTGTDENPFFKKRKIIILLVVVIAAYFLFK
jgi:hypothetical protein